MNPRSRTGVLTYHGVGLAVSSARDTFLNVPTGAFRRQMRTLESLGYTARSFGDVVDAVRRNLSLPRRTFAVTFDDSYRCIAEVAAPILREHGFPATLFVVTGWTSPPAIAGPEGIRPAEAVIGWDQLKELAADSWEIGGHTVSHPRLNELDDAAAYEEIVSSRCEIANRLGIEPRTFCYPFGQFNERTPNIVREAGYIGACTVRSGLVTPACDVYRVPRVSISYRDGVTGLLYRLLCRPHLPSLRPRRRLRAAPSRARS
jgi:peptidoglycan/xylan/chitin deacetylase (PgdA/CDA1 family)